MSETNNAAVTVRADVICGRDAVIYIDGKRLMQADKAEIRRSSQLHAVRTVFCSDDNAHVRIRKTYKATLEGLRFLKPFENLSFADLDNFTMTMEIDGKTIRLSGCMWDDFLAAADKKLFRERISILAMNMETEEEE